MNRAERTKWAREAARAIPTDVVRGWVTSRHGDWPSCFVLSECGLEVVRGIPAEGGEIIYEDDDDASFAATVGFLKSQGLVFGSLEQAATYAQSRGWPGYF